MANESNNALILGSNPGLRDSVKAHLRGLGFTILKSTGSGESALEELSYEDTTCSIILCEMNLDDMSCRKFLENFRTMPEFDKTMIFLMYSDDEIDKVESCLELGIGGLIQKPFNTDHFNDLLQIPYRKLKSLNGNFKALFLTTLAYFSESRSRFKTALKYHSDVLKISKSAHTYFDLGRLFIQTKNPELAQVNFKKAEELDQEFIPRISKFLELNKINLQASTLQEIAKSALKLFNQPLHLFSNSFYNSALIKKSMIIGGVHSERLSMKTCLTSLGIKQVLLHEDPVQALKVLRDSDIDLVITWLKFPDSDAANLTEVLRGIYSHRELKIIVLITEQQIDLFNQVIERGADGFFIMPFTPERFCQRLHVCMVLHDLCSLSGPAEPLAKTAHAMFDCEKYSKGKAAATQGLQKNAKDPACKLFLAMNLHMMGSHDEAFECYESLSQDYPELRELSELTRKRLELIAPKPKKKSVPKTRSLDQDGNTEVQQDESDPSDDSEIQTGLTDSKDIATKRRKKKPSSRISESLVDTIVQEDLALGAGKIQTAPDSDLEDPGFVTNVKVKVEPSAEAETEPDETEEGADASPKRIKKRAKFDQRKDFLGTYSSLGELQSDIFGKVEEALNPKSIPDALAELGVSEANLLLPLGLEQVFGLGQIVPQPTSGPGRIIQLEDRVIPWMPTEKIKKLSFKIREPQSKGGQPEAPGGPDIPKSVALVTGQAQLLNSRIVCLPDSYEESKNLAEYLKALGKVVAQDNIMTQLKLDSRIDPWTQKLIENVKSNTPSDERNIELGRAIVKGGYADDLFSKLTNIEASDPEQAEHMEQGLNYEAIGESVERLKEPIIRFHRECLEGKKEFENSLRYVMESVTKKDGDFEMLYRAMERDHNSLESFKKIYTMLSKSGNEEALEKFFKEKHKDYLKNKKSRRSLNRFLLAMGDKRRARQVSIKSIKEDRGDPDSLKAMALICFQEGDHKNAILCCEKIISQNVYLEYAYNLLGIIYKKMNRLDDAIEHYRKGIEAEPESVKLHHNIAIAYALNREANKSKRALERSKKLKKLQGL